MRGIPVHQELMQEEYPVAGWYMGKKMYQEFCAVRNQITSVKFRTTFENELFELDRVCFQQKDAMEKAVSTTYNTMQMILAES